MSNAEHSDIPFIFLIAKTDREEKLKSLKLGVVDYIHKPFYMDELKAKIESIVRNRQKIKEKEVKKFEQRIQTIIQSGSEQGSVIYEDTCLKYNLSFRERQVLQFVLEGKQIKEIAHKLDLSVHTIRNHVQRIYKKCNVQNRVELLNVFRG